MRIFCWICWFLWECFTILVAHPVPPTILAGSDDSWQRDFYCVKYILGFLGVTITAFTLVGCLCCNRNHRSKGFQEFKDERIIDEQSSLHHSFVGLELEIPRSANASDQIQFHPVPTEYFISENCITNKPKPPTSPSIFEEENCSRIQDSCREWCSANDLHLSRERLKYLREIGQGWFGKVIEGRTDLEDLNINDKIGNVVVKILSDEATAREKAWFLAEAAPYFKLRHRNILSLIGCCLETDPCLLIFESCPFGDLKGFLRSNRDSQSRDVLSRENMLTRIALDIGAGLQHMHDNGFAHTDLSARNCLVSTDLSVKLGDYGTGVEKYPLDYYVVGDRALPIRWSAPESLECSESVIETREITPCANIWSYAILLWEIITWGERPYDELDDEAVIQMLLSKPGLKSNTLELLLKRFENFSCSILEVIHSCLNVDKAKRTSLEQVRKILVKECLRDEEFERRWKNSQSNSFKTCARSTSLKDLSGNVEFESWSSLMEEKSFLKHDVKFPFNPQKLPKSILSSSEISSGKRLSSEVLFQESDSETEEENWKVKVERGAYTEKVKQKSKSVTDLMILVHIDSDSDADWSLGPQISEKSMKRKLTLFGSDGDLRNKARADEFDQELKKLRDISNSEKYGYRLTTEIGSRSPFLNYVPEHNSTLKSEELLESYYKSTEDGDSLRNNNSYSMQNVQVQSEMVDVTLSSEALNSFLEKNVSASQSDKMTLMPLSSSFSSIFPCEMADKSRNNMPDLGRNEVEVEKSPCTERGEIENLSKPNDECNSNSDFVDKEVYSKEEGSRSHQLSPNLEVFANRVEEDANEEQLRVLLELDSILDAEYCESVNSPFDCSTATVGTHICQGEESEEKMKLSNAVDVSNNEIKVNNDRVASIESKSKTIASNVAENDIFDTIVQSTVNNDNNEINRNFPLSIPYEQDSDFTKTAGLDKDYCLEQEENDEDSSTVSLHSNNSYASFSLDEEFVAAIRNELREKLPHTQMSIIEYPELQSEDELPNFIDKDATKWDYDDVQDSTNRSSGVDISIRYNMYDTTLSPIFEERESNINSESVISKDESEDASIASKHSIPEDFPFTDTHMSKIELVEGKDQCSLKNEHTVSQVNPPEVQCEDNFMREQIDKFNGTPYYLCDESAEFSEGAPLPSPEKKSKWHERPCSLNLSLPVQLRIQGGLMPTDFVGENDWDSQEEEDVGEEEDEGDVEDVDIDDQADDEDNSSSSGEFVYKQCSMPSSATNNAGIQNLMNQIERENVQLEGDEQIVEDNDENEDHDDEEEFTPSAWDANLAPHRSALRSPDKTLKSNDQKKSVWFKKQRYHCVYEYPKEAPVCDKEDQISAQWEPTAYADWEEMTSEPRLDLCSLDEDATSRDEFCISSSNRPFQFEASGGAYVSQFFPGAECGDLYQFQAQKDHQMQQQQQQNQQSHKEKDDEPENQQSGQLGELRHTRNRLKLNFATSNEIAESTTCSLVKPSNNDNSKSRENQLLEIEKKMNDSLVQPIDSSQPNE